MWVPQLHELIRSVIGAGEPVHYDPTPGTDQPWYRGQHRGAVVWYAIREGGDDRGRSVLVAASLHGRPLCLWVHHRGSAIHLGAPPEVSTGDPQFDATCEVHGFPAEVLVRVLNESTRRRFASRWPNERAISEQGCLRLLRRVPLGDPFRFDVPREAVVAWFDEVVDLTGRLVAAFDAQHAAIAQHHGHAAARAWADELRSVEGALAATRVAERRGFNRMLMLIIAIPVVAVLVVTVAVLLSFLW